jgi:hypothetical protein
MLKEEMVRSTYTKVGIKPNISKTFNPRSEIPNPKSCDVAFELHCYRLARMGY